MQSLRAAYGFTRSLRFKATAAVAAFIVMISVLLSALFVVHVERVEGDHFLATMNQESSHLASLVADAIARRDQEAARSIVHSYARDVGILYVSVRDREGAITMQDGSPSATATETAIDGETVTGVRGFWIEEDDVYEITRPLVAPDAHPGGEVVGELSVGFSHQPARARVREIRWRASAIAGAMIVLGIMGTMFLVGTIVSPIQDLAEATKRISQGDYDLRMDASSDDEVGVLTRSFDEMVGRLREARERQTSWNEELAVRVKEKTKEIEATRQHLANIVENVGASILVADLDGTIVSANGHTMEVFGTKPEWAIGLHLDEFIGDPERSVARTSAALAAGDGPIVYEVRRQDPHAEQRDLLITHTLLRGVDGEPAGLLQITKDVTDVRGLEERLVETERLSRMGEMAGEIGHELNNYLMAIGGRADLIQLALDRGNLRKVRSSAEIIVDQVSEMRKLTDGLLESARKESSPEEFDLNELVRSTVEFVRPQNKYDRIEFILRIAEEPLPVRADPQQIRQVVLNLLSNGAESIAEARTSGGCIEITTRRDGSVVGFSVADNGAGIADATRPRVFEPHFTTKAHGHGFGLAVCHRVITNHAGEISVSSSPGRGATFGVSLPLHASGNGREPMAGPTAPDQLRSRSSS